MRAWVLGLCLFLALLLVPASSAGGFEVQLVEYEDRPSWTYYNLAVYEGVKNPLFFGRLIRWINSTMPPTQRWDALTLEKVDRCRSIVYSLLAEAGVKGFYVAYPRYRPVVIVYFHNSTYDWGLRVLKGHLKDIRNACGQLAGEAGARIGRLQIITIRLPIDPPGSKVNLIVENIEDKLAKINGGRVPEWYAGTVFTGDVIVEVIVERPGLMWEGVTLREALDQIRMAIRMIAGEDVPVAVEVIDYKLQIPPPESHITPFHLALVALAAGTGIAIVATMRKRYVE